MSPNNEDSSDKDDLDDPSSVPKEIPLNKLELFSLEGGRAMQRKPIGNQEEHDSSLASNVPWRWINHRGGSPGEIAGRNSQCKEIRI